ncbi:non-ribosomal peptide synthetase, partial [Paenibacillus alvei]|uniref:non-ribosomal peptide synthetase n=1 Tax=Paenibacillus alvei TaxID=44250 RepID=UPI0018CDF58E
SIAGRSHADLQGMLGMFVNTLALRMTPSGEKPFSAYLEEVKQTALGALEHGDYPFEELVEQVVKQRDMSRNPLFDAMLVLQNTEQAELELAGLQWTPYPMESGAAKFDLTLSVSEHEQGMRCTLEYASKLFERTTIERWAGHFTELLRQAVYHPQALLGSIEMLTADEREELLVTFNDTAVELPAEATVHALFEQQAARTPEQPALVSGEAVWTYGELEARANRIAGWLRAHGVRSEDRVGVLLSRSPQLIAGLLGVLKAGAAYVPLDPALPAARIEGMIQDAGIRILLSEGAQTETVADWEETALRHVLCLDEERSAVTEIAAAAVEGKKERLAAMDSEVKCSAMVKFASAEELEAYSPASGSTEIQSDVPTTPMNSAYVIYTSGTTGTPKGVVVEHRNVVNFIAGMMRSLPFVPSASILSVTTVSFDIFVTESWVPLSCGMQIVLASEAELQDPALLGDLLAEHPVQLMQTTPSRVSMMLEQEHSAAQLRRIPALLIGGEPLPAALLKQLREQTNASLYNMYGPTETTVWSTFEHLKESEGEKVSIGRPLANTQAYVLNEALQLQPIGAVGELCLGGAGVVRGYWAREELTREKFVDHPYILGERIYRTGDLARWLPDGRLEHLGRIDHQVKIRGYRIEPGEIEAHLLRVEGVKEAVVTVAARETQELCAYVTGSGELTAQAMRSKLAAGLPSYMIPTHFIRLEKMPLTPNGKLDRKALPAPEGALSTGTEYAAPRTTTEAKLAQLWQEVLGLERVGIHDNFFDIGGHSLRAMTLISRVNKEMSVSLPLRNVFFYPTVEEMAQAISKLERLEYAVIPQAEARNYYPVSSAQKRMYILQQFEGAELSYSMPAALLFHGRVDFARLEQACRELIARHEVLRTGFDVVDGEPVQRISAEVAFDLPYREAGDRRAEDLIREFIRPFDLSQAPLLRVQLTKLTDMQHLLLFDMHHIISDGTSMGILIEEVTRLYAGDRLEPVSLHYKDYAVWLAATRHSNTYVQQKEYWLQQLGGELPVLQLPADFARPSIQSFAGSQLDFTIDAELTASIKQLAQDTGTTLFMVLLAAYSMFLGKLAGQDEIIVGTPIAGRPHADLSGMLGMFVNTLAIRSMPSADKTFRSYLGEMKQLALTAFEHAEYPFEELVEHVVRHRDVSRNPIFDAMFVLQNMNRSELQMADVDIAPYELENPTSKFDLSLFIHEVGEELHGSLEYATALFEANTISRWKDHFITLLRHTAANPDVTLGKASLLNEQDRMTLQGWMDGSVQKTPDASVHQLFRKQAKATPEAIALVCADTRLTYGELDRLSDRMAAALRLEQIGSDRIVGLMAGRSAYMMIGLLGILKAGAAFLPIDPSYPAERIAYMLEDSKVACLLADAPSAPTCGGLGYGGKTLIIEELLAASEQSAWSHDSSSSSNNSNNSDSGSYESDNESSRLLYVIYTSGTTGKPKGVMLEHGNLVNLIMHQYERTSIPFDKQVLQYASYSFDVSYQEIFSTLLAGGTLHVIDEDMRQNPTALFRYVEERGIPTLLLPSSFVKFVWNDPTYEAIWPTCVQHLITAGEALIAAPALQRYLQEQGVTLHNHYGPSETHVATTYTIRPQDPMMALPPIGKPISNSSVYILDGLGQLQPIGVAGELYIGGACVGRGYLHQPGWTQEKFLANPWLEGTRMYRTGDRARWLADGNLEYLGRIDHQVKIRGYRIEPGEIETRLLALEGIREAAVVALPDERGSQELCAYVAGEREFTFAELREALRLNLPDYMIPAYVVQLEELPLTSNGKIDRKALPEPEGTLQTGTEYAAPRTTTEAKLAQLWQEVLGLERVGIRDNFFDIGGHSLRAMTLVSRIHQTLEAEVPLRQLFLSPTIEGLAAALEATEGRTFEALVPAPLQAAYPLSSAQKRLYVLQQLEGAELSYNMPAALRLTGTLDRQRLEAALQALIARHESLRTAFSVVDGEPMQRIVEAPGFTV